MVNGQDSNGGSVRQVEVKKRLEQSIIHSSLQYLIQDVTIGTNLCHDG